MKKNRFALLGVVLAVHGLALAQDDECFGRRLSVEDGLPQDGGGEVAAAVQAGDVQAQAEQHQQGVADVGDGVAQQQQVQTEPDAVAQQQAQAEQQQAENPGVEQQV